MKSPMSKTVGFTVPSEPDSQDYFDFNAYLVKNPSATITVQAGSESMCKAGIGKGDLLVIDRTIKPKSGQIVLVDLSSNLTIRRFVQTGNHIELHPDNFEPNSKIIKPKNYDVWSVIGVVTFVIKAML